MNRKMLLADDSVTIQKVVELTFADKDMEIVTADDGRDAVQRAKEIQPDIILVDANLPGINGYDFCKTIRDDKSTEEIPLLILAGAFENFDEEASKDSGANGFIVKPFRSADLISRVDDLMSQKPLDMEEAKAKKKNKKSKKKPKKDGKKLSEDVAINTEEIPEILDEKESNIPENPEIDDSPLDASALLSGLDDGDDFDSIIKDFEDESDSLDIEDEEIKLGDVDLDDGGLPEFTASDDDLLSSLDASDETLELKTSTEDFELDDIEIEESEPSLSLGGEEPDVKKFGSLAVECDGIEEQKEEVLHAGQGGTSLSFIENWVKDLVASKVDTVVSDIVNKIVSEQIEAKIVSELGGVLEKTIGNFVHSETFQKSCQETAEKHIAQELSSKMEKWTSEAVHEKTSEVITAEIEKVKEKLRGI